MRIGFAELAIIGVISFIVISAVFSSGINYERQCNGSGVLKNENR